MAVIDRRGASVGSADPPATTSPNPGLAIKTPCICATTANIALSGLQTIDGYTTQAGDRVLVKNQTDQTTNGIYSASSGNWTRTADANDNSQWTAGVRVFVIFGTFGGNTDFACVSTNPILLGGSRILFSNAASTGSLNIATPGAVKNGAYTGSIGNIVEGSVANPVTVASSTIFISKYQERSDDSEGGQDAPIFIYNVVKGTSNYNRGAQGNGLFSWAKQTGSGDAVGIWGQAQQSGVGVVMDYPVTILAPGFSYTISSIGTTDFIAIGAASNTVGLTFTASGPGTGSGTAQSATVAATALSPGWAYKIVSVGTTDFTLVGAASNVVGTQFRASGAGTGSGTAQPVVGYTAWAFFANAVADAGTIAGVCGYEANMVNNTGFDHTILPATQGAFASMAFDAVSNGANRVAIAYLMRGATSQFDVGVYAGGAPISAVVTTFLRDDSASVNVLVAKNAHVNGVDFSGATFSGFAFKSPGFLVDGAGNVTSMQYNVAGTKVVGARATGWINQTATPSKADLGASPTVGALAQWASAMDAMLKAHGLTGT